MRTDVHTNSIGEQPTINSNTPDWTDTPIAPLRFEDASTGGMASYPSELDERERWMGAKHGSKNPFAPWGDENPPVECSNDECPADRADAPECDCDGRFKWGFEGHYRNGDTVDMLISMDRLAHRAYIFCDGGENVFVDMDDVRCPETGDVHPVAIAFLAHAGLTWVAISSSGTGLHAVYRAEEIPGGAPQADWQIDTEPWGTNEDPPAIELYDNKHVAVLTGWTVPGAPLEVREWNDDAVEAVMRAVGEYDERSTAKPRPVFSPSTSEGDGRKTGGSGSEGGVTTDIEDVYAAINALDAREVCNKTICEEWFDDPKSSDEAAFRPSWAASDYTGTAVFCSENAFTDSGKRGTGYGGPVEMAAIDKGIIPDRGVKPGCVTGDDFEKAVDHLRDLGFEIPYLVDDDGGAELYLGVLGKFAEEDWDPWLIPEQCLVACLRAREAGAVPDGAEPPVLALNPILSIVTEDVEDVSDAAHRLGLDTFSALDAETAAAEFGVDVNGGDSA